MFAVERNSLSLEFSPKKSTVWIRIIDIIKKGKGQLTITPIEDMGIDRRMIAQLISGNKERK
jgi:hypothetical protein